MRRIRITLLAAGLAALTTVAHAGEYGQASDVWSTEPGDSTSSSDHLQDGSYAGMVNAGKGLNQYNSSNIYSIGVWNSLSVQGNNNSVNGDQYGSSVGDQTTTGTINDGNGPVSTTNN